MPKKSEFKFNLISKFLDLEQVDVKDFKKVEDILNLSISSFNFLSSEDVDIINDVFEVKNIEGFTKLDENDPFKNIIQVDQEIVNKYMKDNPDFEEKVKKAITISGITKRIKVKSITKTEQKIVVAGLQNAGKTAILNKFGGKLGMKDLALLKPTKGVNTREIVTDNLDLGIWDLGGQVDYRVKYLTQPERYFLGVDLLIYVIDVQDTDLYDESIEYLEKVIEIILRLELNPSILIFIHKLDPDLRDNPDIQLNVELLKDLVKTIFTEEKLEYEIFLTSIYSMVSNEPNFTQFVKNIMQDSATLADTEGSRMEVLSEILEKTLSMVIQLSENTMRQLSALENRVAALEAGGSVGGTAGGLTPPPPSALKPPPQITPAPKAGPSPRAAIVSELRELFAKRR